MKSFNNKPIVHALLVAVVGVLMAGQACAQTVNRVKYPITGLVVVPTPGNTNPPGGGTGNNEGAGTPEQPAGQGVLAVSPGALAFGNVPVGQLSDLQAVTVSNTGSGSLSISALGIASGAAVFAQNNNCAGTLAPAASCVVNVRFSPNAAATHSGVLAVVAGGTTRTVSLSGTGQVGTAALSDIEFGTQDVGAELIYRSVLSNTGSLPWSLTPPGASSVTGDGFSFASTNCGSVLNPGGACDVNVRFAPSSSGPKVGYLQVQTSLGTQLAHLSGSARLMSLTSSTHSLEFNPQPVNVQSEAQLVVLTNTGEATLTVSSVQVSSGTPDFAQTNNCTSLPVGGSCTISATFTPTAVGARSGSLTVSHNGTGGSTQISMAGTGSAPALNVNLTKTTVDGNGWQHYGLNFGNTGLNTAAPAQTFTLSAVGSPVNLSSVALYTGNPEYTVSHDCPATLAAASSCTVTVNLTPYVAGTRVGSIRILSSQGTAVVDLTANAQQTTASVAPAGGLTFATTNVNSTSAAQTITVNNTGAYPMTVASVAFESGAADYLVQSNGCTTVAAGGSCSITVAFRPSAAGARPGSLAITNNSSTSKLTVGVTGSGFVPTFDIALTKTTVDGNGWQHYSLNFGNTTRNVAAPARTFTITAGATAVNFSTLGIYTGNPEYTVSHTCGSTLAAGASCTVTVNLTPYVAGTRGGTIRIFTNVGNSVVDLTTSASP